MQAGIQEEAGDLAAAWRSLRQRDDLPFSCQSNYLCHQIQVVEILLHHSRYAEAQLRIRLGLKHVYEACLPEALKLLRLFCRILRAIESGTCGGTGVCCNALFSRLGWRMVRFLKASLTAGWRRYLSSSRKDWSGTTKWGAGPLAAGPARPCRRAWVGAGVRADRAAGLLPATGRPSVE